MIDNRKLDYPLHFTGGSSTNFYKQEIYLKIYADIIIRKPILFSRLSGL